MARLIESARSWLFAPEPVARVAVLRLVVYGFVILDLAWLRPWVFTHGDLPSELYRPLALGRILSLPAHTPALTRAVGVALLILAIAGLAGKLPRLVGGLTFFFYLYWQLIAFSYGKVDHDRLALLVALAVLPTAGAVSHRAREEDWRAGWAIHMVQIAAVLTYLLAAFAKFRFGGIEWLYGATLARAIVQRGSFLADPLLGMPAVLVGTQWAIVAFELGSPLMLRRDRWGRAYVVTAFVFHAIVFSMMGLFFWPQMVALCAFLPLERLAARDQGRFVNFLRTQRTGVATK